MSDIHEELLKAAVDEFDQLVREGHIIRIENAVAYDDTLEVARVRRLVRAFGAYDRTDLAIFHSRQAFEDFKARQSAST